MNESNTKAGRFKIASADVFQSNKFLNQLWTAAKWGHLNGLAV